MVLLQKRFKLHFGIYSEKEKLSFDVIRWYYISNISCPCKVSGHLLACVSCHH